MSNYIGRIFGSKDASTQDWEQYVFDNRANIASVNEKYQTVELRNGDKVQWIVFRFAQDQAKLQGLHFDSVETFGVDPALDQYIQARVKQ